ncbi:MAG: serine hydrolase domain-containing protein [Ilumatobacteraceae bacterium]
MLTAACGQARAAAPPEPEFTSGERAEPTVVSTPMPTEGDIVLPDDVETGTTGLDDMGLEFDVSDMVVLDDAGNASPNLSGWARFDAAMERRLGGNQASSVAVMIDGQVVHEAAFGVRVAGGDPVETTDRFRIASISKTVTAIVVMQLVEDGVLTLDDPIGRLLIDHLSSQAPTPTSASITVASCSATRRASRNTKARSSRTATSCTDAAIKGLSSNVNAGNGYRYSSMSYCVLGILIEAVTGQAYERVVDDRLLQPLGIEGMRLTSTYELGPDEVSHFPTPNRNFMEVLGAAGSWNATPADLVTILNSIDHATPSWKAVSAETARSMRFPGRHRRRLVATALRIINYENDTFGHTGTIQNTRAMVLHQPDGITWAVTVAGNSPSESGNLRSIVRNALAEAFG